jgi:Lsr2
MECAMAQRVEVLLTDDLDGTNIPAGKDETVTFGLDGKSYEIDLTAKNASALRKALQPYIAGGRSIKGSRREVVRTRVGADTRTIKEWARANGYQVSDRGRIPNAVREAFECRQLTPQRSRATRARPEPHRVAVGLPTVPMLSVKGRRSLRDDLRPP